MTHLPRMLAASDPTVPDPNGLPGTAGLFAPDSAAPWHADLVLLAADLGLLVLGVGILLCILRLLKGPHLADRAVAVDTIAIHLIGVVVLYTLKIDSLVLFDGILILSLLGFAGTLAMAQYVMRPHIRRRAAALSTP
ncbi:MAG: monovalent cation/H+ antiporter complex subunit F [Phycisphaerae bacterium]